MSIPLVIIGSGAHARKLSLYADLLGIEIKAFIDENSQSSSPIAGVPFLQDENTNDFPDNQHFIVAIGDSTARKRLVDYYKSKGWELSSIVHPSAYVAKDVLLGAGAVICANAVVETGSVIGLSTIIDVGVIVDHDSHIGDYCHLKPGIVLPSYSRVSDGALILAS